MNVLISGGTGFIGSALCQHLIHQGYSITLKLSNKGKAPANLPYVHHLSELPSHSQFNAVINLAGAPIADKRWSDAQKQLLISSRVESTQALITYFKAQEHKPSVFINGSAIGYYGCTPEDAMISENGLPDNSFASQLCQQWEATAQQAQTLGIRTCILRTGIVLGDNGGALQKMLPAFKLALGGRLASGRQWMPWIHLDDMVNIIHQCLFDKQLSGPINATAPTPVTNEVFTQQLAQRLKRPALLPMPSLLVKLLFGQMGDELLSSGKRVVPDKLNRSNFSFQYSQLKQALASLHLK